MSRTKYYTSDEILDGIKNNKKEILIFVYCRYYPIVEGILNRNHGVACVRIKDYFQEALLSIFTNLHSGTPVTLQYSFITYLMAICKRKMIDDFRRKKELKLNLSKHDMPDPAFTINDVIIKDERIKLVHKHFLKLGDKCRKIMTLFLKGFSIKEITETLNMSSEKYTKKRRQLCKITLFKSIFNDQIYKELTDGKP